MKKITLLFAGMFAALFTYAQLNTEEIDFFQSIYGMEKKAIVEEFVQPKTDNRVPFWEVYDAYEVERKKLGKDRIDLLEKFAEEYETMTNEQSEVWMKKVIALAGKQDKLIVSYYKKVKKVTSPIVAMRFYQLEGYLLTAIRYEILDVIPFVEEK
ncbi:MAG: hypothetical protein HQ565_04285 [Bacteroidetes bacterium]|nr:hypothetical protein [Bacteroidota bacterium]